MPRYKGATKYEREQYARSHFNFMANKHSTPITYEWEGETRTRLRHEDNYEQWVAGGNRDQPVPYSRGFIGLKWFLQLIEGWPLYISDYLESEFYGDACDRKYIRELLRTLELYGYYDDGAYIEIMAGGSGFSPLPKPKNGEWDEESIYSNKGTTNVFKGSEKNRVRVGFVLDWLQEKEEAEARKEKLYDEQYFYDDTEGEISKQEEVADTQLGLAYGSTGNPEDVSAVLTNIGWVDATDKPLKQVGEAALMAAAEVLIYYSVLAGGAGVQANELAKKFGLRPHRKVRLKLEAKSGSYPEEYFTIAAAVEKALPKRSGHDPEIFQPGGLWSKEKRSKRKD